MRYIVSRLLVAGAERTDLFTAEAVDYIFRCSEGIPRQINNICDNALLAAFAAGVPQVSRELVREVAENFDLLPRNDYGRQVAEERAVTAPLLTPDGRQDLMAAYTTPAVPIKADFSRERTPSRNGVKEDESSRNYNLTGTYGR
jgi:general secretion pathway protein A